LQERQNSENRNWNFRSARFLSGQAKSIAVENPQGGAPVLLVCDHASRFIPSPYGNLGLSEDVLSSHAAWDPGAIRLARRVALLLDAPLIAAAASRLLVDPNRAPGAHDLIPLAAGGAAIPGNNKLTDGERLERLARFHAPYHATVASFLASRPNITALVSIHTFEPELFGAARPWHVGVLYDPSEASFADLVADDLAREPALVIGRNEPYSPADGVYYTLDLHARANALESVMLEVRNDLVLTEAGIEAWAERLARVLHAALVRAQDGASPEQARGGQARS
jgi:predicted N-formylglutamate amidohydrolase